MLIENEFQVAAPVEKVWAYLLDVPKLAPCLPGAELVGDDGDGTYRGSVTAKLGPVALRFAGTAKIVEADEAARRIVMDASGSEEKGKGTASMRVTSVLVPAGRTTTVKVSQDLQVSGAAAQYGRGMISDVTTVLMKSFAECLQSNLDAEGRGETTVGGRHAAAKPVGGFGIGFKAATLALKRVFGRLFGPANPDSTASKR
jgi:carbon monoxide dehydrogenase subunit G